MKANVFLLAAVLLVTGCGPVARTVITDPCNDSTFLALQKRNMDSLSVAEYDYYRTKREQCDKQLADKNSESNIMPLLITTGVLAVLAIILWAPGGH